MYDMGTRKRTLALLDRGRSLNSVSKETGISRAAIRSWQVRIEPLDGNRSQPCPRCRAIPEEPDEPAAYAYLQRYEYPRYFFTNKSSDIMRLFTDTLDAVGVDWKQPNSRNISIARVASVALMDARVRPKY
ncbi:hypothetical protein [Streptomyces sp. NPDC002685]|uniref:hypothetical protein n=1 Tax=Streptomyces sp. NPDC002685 TaxID=3154540 RepID=UPI00331C6876